jgi:putative DNA methylase
LGRFETLTDKKGTSKQVVRGLVSWDDIKEPDIIHQAQREIARCLAWERGDEPPTKPDAVRDYIAQYAPPAYDPFAGGGSIPLEAQRLGLEAHASDLNPVAVLINKALIEIPPRFRDQAPVNPEALALTPSPSPSGRGEKKPGLNRWYGAQGLAADVRFYGSWMRERAFEKIGHLYPKVSLSPNPSPTGRGGHDEQDHSLSPNPSPTGRGGHDTWEISAETQKQMLALAKQFRREATPSEAISRA